MPSRDTTKPRTATRQGSPGLRFVVTAAILSVSLFGILRIPFIEQNLLLPFTKAQHSVACRIGGNPDAPISVGLSCSASDVIALCLGFVLAFPVSWRKRLAGAAMGLLFIATVNTVRIATLSHAIESRRWFDLLHVYIWPGVLLVVVSLFVFFWMSHALRSDSRDRSGLDRPRLMPLLAGSGGRFVLLTLLFVALFVGSSSWWMHSRAVLTVANWVAAAGAAVIRLFAGEVTLSGNVLRTASGGFVVTQECIMTPLIPAYFAAALALPMTRRLRVVLLLAAFPVFFVLGAARLLVLAFPSKLVGSHLIAIHGFYQFLLAIVLIAGAAFLSSGRTRNPGVVLRSFLVALTAGILAFTILALTYNRLLLAFVGQAHELLGHSGHQYMDPQGALLVMAPYQISLLLALWVAWGLEGMSRPRAAVALGGILLAQPLLLVLIGEWVAHTGIEAHVAALRALTVLMVLAAGAWAIQPSIRAKSGRSFSPVEAQHG